MVYNVSLYSNEKELTMLHAATRFQNYNIEWKKQITKEYIQHDTTYVKFKILQIYSVVYERRGALTTSDAGDKKVHNLAWPAWLSG